jgi:ABC-type Fe3+/spermidine/putrescine transport system ATPase subunit
MILIENLRYHSLTIDSLVLEEGITTIIGENGSGKTSFLKLVAGIALPESGTLCIDGKDPRTRDWLGQ